MVPSIWLDVVIEVIALCSVVCVAAAACTVGCLSCVSKTGIGSEILSGGEIASEEGRSVGFEGNGSGEPREGNGNCCTVVDPDGEGAATGVGSTDSIGERCKASVDFSGTGKLPASAVVGNELVEFVRVEGFDADLDLNGTPVFQVNVDGGIGCFVGWLGGFVLAEFCLLKFGLGGT